MRPFGCGVVNARQPPAQSSVPKGFNFTILCGARKRSSGTRGSMHRSNLPMTTVVWLRETFANRWGCSGARCRMPCVHQIPVGVGLLRAQLANEFYIQCCDNETARYAVIRGVGKHQPLNALISAHSTWRNRRGIARRLERVPTKANISDPVSRFEALPDGLLWSPLELKLRAPPPGHH